MPVNLPYLASPSSISNALTKIRSAATPDRVTRDFVNTVLLVKGGTGAAIAPFLKRIGLVASDGTPTELYKRFRNTVGGGTSIAEAISLGYKELKQANEYFHMLSDRELLSLIVQVTGAEANGAVPKLTLSTLKNLMAFADFNSNTDEKAAPAAKAAAKPSHEDDSAASQLGAYRSNRPAAEGRVGLNLSYTINLNLPATSDQAVFNAIFRSLKEHLLSNDE